MRTVLHNGKQEPVEQVMVAHATESWATYVLADGTTIKTRAVVPSVWKFKNVQDEKGGPLYHFTAQINHFIDVPPK